MSSTFTQEFIEKCQSILLEKKAELLNRSRAAKREFVDYEKTGDEIDLTVANQLEHHFLVSQDRIREQLFEIEMALGRIENNQFGICEETEEQIEIPRLMSIPWTRLSIEGAEIRESRESRFAR